MISVIVCSVNDLLFKQFEQSLKATIGVDFEIIKIDNKNNKYSICEAYNMGAGTARFNHLCFAHEDILFRSDNWGVILLAIFANMPEVGLVGVAGSNYKSLSPAGWPTGDAGLDRYHMIQRYIDGQADQISYPENAGALLDAKVLDGVFLCTTKQIWQTTKFDEDTFKGFHCYDLDFCLQVGRKHKIMVCYELLLEHLSSGSEHEEWIDNSILLSQKWRHCLPIGDISYKRKVGIEWYQKKTFALKMRIRGFSVSQVLSVFFSFGYLRFFNLRGNFVFAGEIISSALKKLKIKLWINH